MPGNEPEAFNIPGMCFNTELEPHPLIFHAHDNTTNGTIWTIPFGIYVSPPPPKKKENC